MTEEVDIFMAKIVRKANNQAWGFRVEGGYNTDHPLVISAVAPGSPAGSIGLRPGDVITKIFDRQTKFITHQQAADIIGAVKNDTLSLTIERGASTMQQDYNIQSRPQPQHHHHHHQYFHNPQPYQPRVQQQEDEDLSFPPPPVLSHDGTYKGSMRINLSSPPNSPPLNSQVAFPPPQFQAASHGDDDDNVIPQSRSFKRLQNFMENNQPLGAAGLPPPRSASMEQMKQQQQMAKGQGRVKVIMPQKYNNPLNLYSADNVIDTFSTQVGSILENIRQ